MRSLVFYLPQKAAQKKETMKIADIVSKNLVEVNLKSRTKESVLSEIVEVLHKNKKIRDKKEILDALLKREAEASTGIGHGLAIPHARIDDLKEAVIFVGVSKHGIDFSSSDAKPAHVIVLFLTPVSDTSIHLKILGRLGFLFKDMLFLGELRSASSNDELYFILKQGDLEIDSFRVLDKESVFLELATSDKGISDQEAKMRLEEYGPNRLKKIKKVSLFKRFTSHFTNLLAILMWVGSGLSFWAQMPEAGWACIVVIFVNALFSFWQEFKAEKAIDALKDLLPSYTRVIRNGEEKRVLLHEVVPGDILLVEEGDSVPADARLIEAYELRVNNSAFSGESKLSHKMAEGFKSNDDFLWLEMPNLIFAGTSVASGLGKAVVIATGMSTEIGKIAYLTQTIKEDLSPLQKEVDRISKFIAAISVVMGLIFFFVGLTFTRMTLLGSAMFAIGIILANVPQGLMPTLTLSLSMAVQRMAKRNALMKKLSSVETLGCTSVICTDKTGTLTTNQMSVRKMWFEDKVVEVEGSGYEPVGSFCVDGKILPQGVYKNNALELLLRIAVLCNTAKLVAPEGVQKYWSIIGDPTEGALLTLARKAGFDIDRERQGCLMQKRFPFESVRKRMSCIHVFPDGNLRVLVKGAPKEILDLSTKIMVGKEAVLLTSEKKTEIIKQIDNFAQEGLRILGFAYRSYEVKDVSSATALEVENDLVFVGATAMYDPPRPEVKEAVSVCKKAGIRVVMITGDYQVTALSIARQVGIVTSDDAQVITGSELSEIEDERLKERLQKKEVVFARVNPDHKLRVVNLFKELGHIVAVTGDGVNDAPALRRADVGVAMGLRGTDVAKESAEMVLIDDNFASIVAAIEEGRAVFDNIRKFITYIFTHLVPEAIPYIFYVIFKLPVPITVMQILAIDLGSEILPALGLGAEKPEPGIMALPPRPRRNGLISNMVLFRGYIYIGLLNATAVLVAFYFILYHGGWRPGVQLEPNDMTFVNPLHLKAMTVVYVGIVVLQIGNVFSCRSEKLSAFKFGFFNNKLILWGIAIELFLVSAIIYIPYFQKIFSTIGLGWQEWGILFIFMIVVFFLEEVRKKIALSVTQCEKN